MDDSLKTQSLTLVSVNDIDMSNQIVTGEQLRNTSHPALARLAGLVEHNQTLEAENYSRMHNRHNRSHSRK